MRHGIVEGEPGIFPPPVARVLQRIGRWVRRERERPPGRAPSNATDDGNAGPSDQREAG